MWGVDSNRVVSPVRKVHPAGVGLYFVAPACYLAISFLGFSSNWVKEKQGYHFPPNVATSFISKTGTTQE